jgi:hypothetical protein
MVTHGNWEATGTPNVRGPMGPTITRPSNKYNATKGPISPLGKFLEFMFSQPEIDSNSKTIVKKDGNRKPIKGSGECVFIRYAQFFLSHLCQIFLSFFLFFLLTLALEIVLLMDREPL